MASDLFASFGIDIAALVNDALGDAMPDAVLTKRTAGTRGADITAGNGLTSVDYPCKGMRAGRNDSVGGSFVRSKVPSLAILAASLPDGVVPEAGDTVTIEGDTYLVSRMKSDEAQAMYEIETPGAGAGFGSG